MVLPRFIDAALSGKSLRVFGDGQQTRCFCDVRDVVQVLPRLLSCPDAYGKVMNIGSDRSLSIEQLAEMVINVLGSESQIERVEYSDAYPAGFEDLRHRKPDLTRIRSLVKFDPSRSMEETIRDMSTYAREQEAVNGGGA